MTIQRLVKSAHTAIFGRFFGHIARDRFLSFVLPIILVKCDGQTDWYIRNFIIKLLLQLSLLQLINQVIFVVFENLNGKFYDELWQLQID